MNQETLMDGFRKLAKKDYSFFLEYAVPGYKHAEHTRYLCDTLKKVESGEIRRLMVSMPPRHSKSETISKFFPAYWIGNNPEDEIMVVSYSADLASDFTKLAKDVMLDKGKEVFGHEIASDTKAKNNWGIADHRGKVFATSIGGVAVGKGYRLGIIDDPLKQEDAGSALAKKKLFDWYKGTFRNRATPDARIIIIQTRWAEDDLIGQLLAEDDDNEWTVINLPAEAEEDDLLGRQPGEWLWPERFPPEEYKSLKKDSGSRMWASLYQGRPAPDDGEVLKRQWWKFYKIAPAVLDTVAISVDATFKDTDNSDYVVMQVWGKASGQFFLLDQIRAKMDFPTTQTALKMLCNKWPQATYKFIEDKANGSAIIQTLQHQIPGIKPVNPQGSKVARAQAVSAYIESGNVFLPEGVEWLNDFVEECTVFPNGKHDDQVDAMSQALKELAMLNEVKRREGRKLLF